MSFSGPKAGDTPWERRLGERPAWATPQGWAVGLGAALAALSVGVLLTRSPLVAVAPLIGLVAVAGIARVGLLAPVELLLAALPWLVILDAQIPPLLRTLATASAALGLLALSMPLRFDDRVAPWAAALFALVVFCHAIYVTEGQELVQSAKFMVLPAMALAVMSRRGRELLPGARNLLLASCLAAMAVHLGIIAAGLGGTSTKYGIGERLGFAAGLPHELGLLGVIVAGAGLATARGPVLQTAFFTLGAVPAVLTGVRSALLAACVVLLLFLLSSRPSPRTVAVVAGVVLLAFVSGAVGTVTARFAREARLGTETGSGRLEIWHTALDNWGEAGPAGWVIGTGLGSIREFELKDIGLEFVGHSDLIEVGVQLGVLGLLAWLTVWLGLLRARLRGLVLVPIAVYAVVNGSIEYVAPLTIGLALAAACADPRPPPDEPAGA